MVRNNLESRDVRPARRALAALVAVATLVVTIQTTTTFAQDFRIIDPAGGAAKAPQEWPPFTHWDLREMPGCRDATIPMPPTDEEEKSAKGSASKGKKKNGPVPAGARDENRKAPSGSKGPLPA